MISKLTSEQGAIVELHNDAGNYKRIVVDNKRILELHEDNNEVSIVIPGYSFMFNKITGELYQANVYPNLIKR